MFSFVEKFKLNLENIKCIDFQFHDAKLIRFIQSAYYTRLCRGCSTKEAIDSFFGRASSSSLVEHHLL